MKDKKTSGKTLKGTNSKWDDTELQWYRQFLKTGTVESLSYTAVQEAHLRRIAKEKLEEKEKRITKALKKMCLGLYSLQNELGIDLRKMALECAEEELEKIIGTQEERWSCADRQGRVRSIKISSSTPLRT